MFRFLLALVTVLFLCGVNAHAEVYTYEDVKESIESTDEEKPVDLITLEDVIKHYDEDTTCSSGVFADALYKTAGKIDADTAFDVDIQTWVAQVFAQEDVLRKVLNCKELVSRDDYHSIKFMPIKHTFENGREIVVNYETQPKVLRDRLRLLERPDLQADTNDPTDGKAIWTNIDPSWYGVMVVEAGTLDQFVGKGKPNTVSLDYIQDNIDRLYPKDHGNGTCASKTAWALDSDAVNEAAVETVGRGPDDPNDYYVAGDKSLVWVKYAEIAADIILTVVTMGTGTAITYSAKMARVVRATDKTVDAMRVLQQTDKVGSYLRVGKDLDKTTDALDVLKAQRAAAADDLADATKKLDNLSESQRKNLADIQNNITRYEDEYRRLVDNNAGAKDIKNARKRWKAEQQKLRTTQNNYGVKVDGAQKKLDDLEEMIRQTEQRIGTLQKRLKAFEKHKDVKKYNKLAASLEDLDKYRKTLKGLNPKRGNVFSRSWKRAKALRAINNGNKILSRSERLVRAGTFSGRVRDTLFVSTRQFAGMLGKVVKNTGVFYGAVNFLGDMYDQTDTSTGDHTNGMDFQPWLLLSADDIEGQENVINYGMWLMWIGDSVVPADDDAAYLQAFDFATKFHRDLLDVQDNDNAPCNVDIYVVRPIVRSPGTDNAKLYYLIMNDVPWSTGS